MKLPNDGHSHFQGLISARLDGLLAESEELELSEHLAECPSCRSTARDYRTQRNLMASLPARPAPRDLWARTAAALDREMARSPHASERGASRRPGGQTATRPAPGSRWLGLTAVTSVLLAGVVVATQMHATVTPTTGPSSQVVQATPFDVAPQDMSVFDFTAHGVSVYQTQVTEACPVLSIDCTSLQLPTLPVVQISGTSSSSRGLAVNSRSGQLALVSSADSGAETVSVVRVPQYRNGSAADTPTQAPTPTPTDAATGSQGLASPAVTATATANTQQPTPSATPTPTSTPTPTTDATPTTRPTHARPTATPDLGTPKPVKTHRPAPSPTEPPATSGPSAPDPMASQSPVAPLPTDAGVGATATGGDLTPQPADAAMAIAEGVRLVGAAPAWSNEGDMFAFSATPADLSTGPDIYLWKVGQAKAVRVTQDHRSYFASWAGDRIVISRAPADDTSGAVDVSTVVLDVGTGEERTVAGAKLWLPAVEPNSRYAVAWVGRLHTDGLSITPRFGGLYLIDWTAIDPFADQPVSATTTPPVGDGSAGETPAATLAVTQPAVTPAPTRTPRTHRASPSAVAPTDAPATPTPVPTAADPTDSATASATDSATAAPLQPVDPQRDETADPVLDWVVSWSADGNTVGIWVADTAGSNLGRLAVVRLSLQDGQFSRVAVLGPTLARRAFSLGVDRVAWVAPSQDGTSSEMRIRTWDANGYGDIRIHNVDAGDSLPSF